MFIPPARTPPELTGRLHAGGGGHQRDPFTRKDYDRKQAYNAAEAGVNYYLYHLNQDDSYWTQCAVAGTPVMQPWDGVSARPWRKVPGDQSQYVVAFTKTCDPNNPASVLDAGLLRFRSTGRSRAQQRTVDVTLRRNGFLDYLYFTNYETQDPISFSKSDPTYASWAASNCLTYRWAGRSPLCKSIVFADRDVIQGPFHTNDNILVCGGPKIGRTGEKVEMGGPPPYVAGGGCTATPTFGTTPDPRAQNLGVPTSNSQLAQVADPTYTFTGRKFITLNAASDTITVADSAGGAGSRTLPWPANGVIYGKTGSNPGDCTYDMQQRYDNGPNCADLYVKGTFKRGLTITTDNDIIVNGPLTKSGNGILGLIATNFVRVYHPVNRTSSSCSNAGGSLGSVEIDAAILSLRHSFIVDNYDCGTTQGTLTVLGAIAQNFRGPVGTGGTTIATGYLKNYLYDDRFATQNPPYFLDPIDSKWQVVRFNEEVCSTATAGACPNKPGP